MFLKKIEFTFSYSNHFSNKQFFRFFLLFILIFSACTVAGYYIFTSLNRKIKGSDTGWKLFGYAVLLIAALCVLFMGGIFLLIYSYSWLKMN